MPVLKIKKNGRWVEVWGSTGMSSVHNTVSSVTVYADRWSGDNRKYFQIVNIEGVTENSKVDLCPSPEQLDDFGDTHVSLTLVNDGGTVTVHARGDMPTKDHTLDVFITDVVV